MSYIKIKNYVCRDGSVSKYYYLAKSYRDGSKYPKAKVYYLGKHKHYGLVKFLIKKWLGLIHDN